MQTELTLKEVIEASDRMSPLIHRTPVFTCESLDRMCNAKLFFKCENLQKAGAFKIRGATNAVFSLGDYIASRGVATHSSGNHGAALSLAALWRGIQAYVVMPEDAPEVKKSAVAQYGGEIVLCEPTVEAREQGLEKVVQRTGASIVHPYNDLRVIAGQGTAALELCHQVPDLNTVLVPVGGGGLISGTAIAVSAISPKTDIIGVEPERADDACRSFRAGKLIPVAHPETIADGLRTSLGDLTFPVIMEYVKDMLTVPEQGIIRAMRLIWERMKLVVEPSASVALGALLNHRIDLSGKRVGLILSGGNVDLTHLPWEG
jgi:threonine dehydratase